MKKILCILLILSFFITFNSYQTIKAEENNLQTFLDIIANAAFMDKDTQIESSEGNIYSDSFLSSFIDASSKYNNLNLSTDNEIKDYLSKTIIGFNSFNYLKRENSNKYIGFKIFVEKLDNKSNNYLGMIYKSDKQLSDPSVDDIINTEMTDMMLSISIIKDKESVYGYKLKSFSFNGDLAFENELTKYYNEKLTDYVNARLGYALKYPSIFPSDTLKENEDGIEAKTKDGKASMFIKTYANSDKYSAKSYYELMKNSLNGIRINYNEGSSFVSSMEKVDENILKYTQYMFTDDNVYTAKFIFDKSMYKDFVVYIQHLKNTFGLLSDDIG